MGYGLGTGSVDSKAASRTVVLASADAAFRGRLGRELTEMRWQVREAAGGAEAMVQLEREGAEALVLDSVLPDLEVGEFADQMRSRHPAMDLLRVNFGVEDAGARSPRRNELLHALRQAQLGGSDMDLDGQPARLGPAVRPRSIESGKLAPRGERACAAKEVAETVRLRSPVPRGTEVMASLGVVHLMPGKRQTSSKASTPEQDTEPVRQIFHAARLSPLPLPGIVGESAGMLELARLVRLVAPRSTSVLIEGETGTGKELVAKAVHELSRRANKPFVVLNCAAIPEALLEAELFGHTRGAFTGAVQSRTGRIEAAHGGTLFLDEIGEMPLALQAKMLRFLESGELQRVGDNEMLYVDVRVVAASHQPLRLRASEKVFRLDLYHRLAVFPVLVPALRNRLDDVLLLATFLLGKLGEDMPAKRLSKEAALRLLKYDWPGNVRELAHVLERGTILAEDRREIAEEEIRF